MNLYNKHFITLIILGDNMSQTIEQTRWALDEALNNWLKANGLTDEQIAELDYSFIDNEYSDLLQGV